MGKVSADADLNIIVGVDTEPLAHYAPSILPGLIDAIVVGDDTIIDDTIAGVIDMESEAITEYQWAYDCDLIAADIKKACAYIREELEPTLRGSDIGKYYNTMLAEDIEVIDDHTILLKFYKL